MRTFEGIWRTIKIISQYTNRKKNILIRQVNASSRFVTFENILRLFLEACKPSGLGCLTIFLIVLFTTVLNSTPVSMYIVSSSRLTTTIVAREITTIKGKNVKWAIKKLYKESSS